MQNIKNNIFISAGEASGDLLGADLARALLKKNPALRLSGMGGQRMRDTGVDIQFDSKKLSVVGLVEIIKQLPAIFSVWRSIKNYLRKTKPDLVILIDFPDTHFRIMKAAKKYGIPVLYYVSPQIWAWRPGRIKQLKKYVDHMIVLFSFEEKIYRDANIPVTFVGHPLSQLAKPSMPKESAYDFFKLDPTKPIVSLFPGSRNSEMENHLSIMIESVKKISEQKPETQFALMLANHFDAEKIRAQLPCNIKIIQSHIYDLLQITTAAIAVSGTVTLEIALLQVPMCIIYKMNALTHWIARKLICVKNIGLCNIVAEKLIVKEFIQNEVKPDIISNETIKLLSDKNYYDDIKNQLGEIKNKITVVGKNASDNVADVAMEV